MHSRHCHYNQQRSTQCFNGRKAEKAAYVCKLVEAQMQRPTVECEGKKLKNVFKFKYLGSIFAADGSQEHDITRRIALAMQRCGQLRQVFSSEVLHTPTKVTIYKTAVTSLLTYGCEAWQLTERAQARINGANARCLARITGRSAHEEVNRRTQTYNLVAYVKRSKMQWLVHLLRMTGDTG